MGTGVYWTHIAELGVVGTLAGTLTLALTLCKQLYFVNRTKFRVEALQARV